MAPTGPTSCTWPSCSSCRAGWPRPSSVHGSRSRSPAPSFVVMGVTYLTLVRPTPIGTLLNGPVRRPTERRLSRPGASALGRRRGSSSSSRARASATRRRASSSRRAAGSPWSRRPACPREALEHAEGDLGQPQSSLRWVAKEVLVASDLQVADGVATPGVAEVNGLGTIRLVRTNLLAVEPRTTAIVLPDLQVRRRRRVEAGPPRDREALDRPVHGVHHVGVEAQHKLSLLTRLHGAGGFRAASARARTGSEAQRAGALAGSLTWGWYQRRRRS